MDIDLIQLKRQELSQRIKEDIKHFELMNGVAVTGIDLERNYGSNYGGAQRGIVSESDLVFVNLRVEL